MIQITAYDFREARREPAHIVSLSENVAKEGDMRELMRLDTLIADTFCSFVIGKEWPQLDALITAIVNSARRFRTVPDRWVSEAVNVIQGWDAFLRLGRMLLDMSTEESAVTFARSLNGWQADILSALDHHEPVASGDLAALLSREGTEISRQSMSNALRKLENHGLISRVRQGRKVMVRLGPTGRQCLRSSHKAPISIAAEGEFHRNVGDCVRAGDDRPNPIPQFKALQSGYALEVTDAEATVEAGSCS